MDRYSSASKTSTSTRGLSVKYLRYRNKGGSLTSDVWTSEGDFIGCNDAETEQLVIESNREALEAAYGVPLTPALADSDPWDQKSPLLENPAAAAKLAADEARQLAEAREAAVQAEMRAMAEERLAAR